MAFDWLFSNKQKLNDELYDAWKKTPRELRDLIRKGADVHYDDDAALRTCSGHGVYENVHTLLSLGANVFAKDNASLILAISYYRDYYHYIKQLGERSNQLKTIKLLLDVGANANARNGEPLKFACLLQKTDIINLLIEYGAYPLRARGTVPNKQIADLLISQKPDPWSKITTLCSPITTTMYHSVRTVDRIKNNVDNCDILFIDIDNTLFCTIEYKGEFLKHEITVFTDAWWFEILRTTKAYICFVTSRPDYNPNTKLQFEKFGIVYDAIYFTNYNDRMKAEIYEQIVKERNAKRIVIVDDIEEILQDAYNKFIGDDSIEVTLFKWVV